MLNKNTGYVMKNYIKSHIINNQSIIGYSGYGSVTPIIIKTVTDNSLFFSKLTHWLQSYSRKYNICYIQ